MPAKNFSAPQRKELHAITIEVLRSVPRARASDIQGAARKRGYELTYKQAHYYLSSRREEAAAEQEQLEARAADPPFLEKGGAVGSAPSSAAVQQRVHLGERELEVLRFVGVDVEQLSRAQELAEFINALP